VHTHSIDLVLPLNLGPLKAQVEHRPYDDDHILVIITPEVLPSIAKVLPRRERLKPREVKVKRSLVREWGGQLSFWADEPTPESTSNA